MLVYGYNDQGDLKLIQSIELDFLPDNPCIPPTPALQQDTAANIM